MATSRSIVLLRVIVCALGVFTVCVLYMFAGRDGYYMVISASLDCDEIVQSHTDRETDIPRRPRVIESVYSPGDVVIAHYVVTDPPYNADNTGREDVTEAVQRALWDCYKVGGGVVWVPAGEYRFDGTLTIGESVTLRGEWRSPHASEQRVEGTIFNVYGGRGDAKARSFISLQSGSGVRGISIYYPEQSINDIQPYPYAISQVGSNVATVMDVTLVNPYQGVVFGEVGNWMHYVRNVYGTPLHCGITADLVYDPGRIENLHFSPKYWANSGLKDAPSFDSIMQCILSDVDSVGIEIGRSDFEVLTKIRIEGYSTGIRFFNNGDGGSNGGIYDIELDAVRIGLDFTHISPAGWSVTAGSIKTIGDSSSVGVLTRPGFQAGSVQLNQVAFGGGGINISLSHGSGGHLSAMKCMFEDWGDGQEVSYAVDANGGSIAIEDSTFMPFSSASPNRHIRLGGRVSSAVILGNIFSGDAYIDTVDPSRLRLEIDHADYSFDSFSADEYEFAKHPSPAKTSVRDLYVVTEPPFGAAGDGCTDDTDAIQRALDMAGDSGGGIVYLPAGRYRMDGHLSVPPGVEFRGVHDVPHHTISDGSVLLAYVKGDRGKENGTPFIVLNSNEVIGGSGIRGVTIWYPEQMYNSITPYPWTIQSQGPGCWLIYTVLSNSYQGVDFAAFNNDGHVIDYLGGAALKTGLYVGNTPTKGWIENVHFNPHFWAWAPATLPGRPPETALMDIWAWQKANSTAYRVGFSNNEVLMGTYVYGSKNGLELVGQKGLGAMSGTVLNHSADGSVYATRISEIGIHGVDFINYQAVEFDHGSFVVIENSVDADSRARFFNTNHWTPADIGYDIQGGNVLLQQVHFTTWGPVQKDGETYGIKVESGTVFAQNCFFENVMWYQVMQTEGTVSVAGSVAAGGFRFLGSVQCSNSVRR
jgi:hypothetical protein